MATPRVLALVDGVRGGADTLLGYWVLPTSCGVGTDMMEYVPGLDDIPVGAETLKTTEGWFESLEKVYDEPSNIYLVFGSIKAREFVVYMAVNDNDYCGTSDASTKRIHKFVLFCPEAKSKAYSKLRKARSRALSSNRNLIARPVVQEGMCEGSEMIWFIKPLIFHKGPRKGRQSATIAAHKVYEEFVAGMDSEVPKLSQCRTLSKVPNGVTTSSVPRRSFTKPTVVLDNETVRRFQAATSNESENVAQLKASSVGNCFLLAPTKMLKVEEDLNNKGRRLFKNIIAEKCVYGDNPFFDVETSAETLAETWRSMKTSGNIGIIAANSFDRALGSAAALLLHCPNFRISTLPSERAHCPKILPDTDQFLAEAIIDIAVAPRGESGWLSLSGQERKDNIERIYNKVVEAMLRKDSGWGHERWINNTVSISTRLLRQLQAEKGENTVAIPSNGALSEVVRWQFQGDENVRVKGKDGNCKLLEMVVYEVCSYFVQTESGLFNSNHKEEELHNSRLDGPSIEMPGGFALVATIGVVFLEAVRRGSRHSGKVLMTAKTYNAKAKGMKVGCQVDGTQSRSDIDETLARKLLEAEEGKATRLLLGLLRLLVSLGFVNPRQIRLRIAFGMDGRAKTASGDKGFLVMNPLPSPELATAIPGGPTGLPPKVSGLTADRIHLMYPPALGMGLSRELCPQTVELESAKTTRLHDRYKVQVTELRQRDPAINAGPTITRIMSYSPTLLAAHKHLQNTCAKDLLNSNTFITELSGSGYCAKTEKASENLELVGKFAAVPLDHIRCNGGTGRVEVQLMHEGDLDDFEEKTFIPGVMSALAIARHSAVVVNARDVADNMEIALTALIAEGKACLDVLSGYSYRDSKFSESQRLAECPLVWEYVRTSLMHFFNGKDVCYQQGACIPRESVLVAGRPLFNPIWKCTYDKLCNINGAKGTLRSLVQAQMKGDTFLYFTKSSTNRRKYLDFLEEAASGKGIFEALAMDNCRARNQDGKGMPENEFVSAYCNFCFQRFHGGSFVPHPCIVGCEFEREDGVRVTVTGAEGTIVRPSHSRFEDHLQGLFAELNANQANTYDMIIADPSMNFYVGGDAGTGKSHLLKFLVRAFDRRLVDTRKLAVIATTNISANHIGGRTINSWLMLAPERDDAAGQAYEAMRSRNCGSDFTAITSGVAENLQGRREEFRRLKVLIIDEIFLVPSHTFALIDAVLRQLRSCQEIPFGGVQVIAFGDAQLQPAAKCWSWFFTSENFTNGHFKVLLLTEVIRQKNPEDVKQLRLLKIGGGEDPRKFLEDVNSSWGSEVSEADLMLCQRASIVYKRKIGSKLQTRIDSHYILKSRVQCEDSFLTHRVKSKGFDASSRTYFSTGSQDGRLNRMSGQLNVLYIVTEIDQEEAYEEVWLEDVRQSGIDIQWEVPTITVVVSAGKTSATLTFGKNGEVSFGEIGTTEALLRAGVKQCNGKVVFETISKWLKKKKVKLEGRPLFKGANVRCLVKTNENLAITKQAVVRLDAFDIDVGTVTLSAYPVQGKGQSRPVTLERDIIAEETLHLKGISIHLSCFALPVRPIVACTDYSLEGLEFSIPIIYDNMLVGGSRCSHCCGKAYMVATRAVSCSLIYFLFPMNEVELKPDAMTKDFFRYHQTTAAVDYYYSGRTRIIRETLLDEDPSDENPVALENAVTSRKEVNNGRRKTSKLTLTADLRTSVEDICSREAAGLSFPMGDGFMKSTVHGKSQGTFDLYPKGLCSSSLLQSSFVDQSADVLSEANLQEESVLVDDGFNEDCFSSPVDTSCEVNACYFRNFAEQTRVKEGEFNSNGVTHDSSSFSMVVGKAETVKYWFPTDDDTSEGLVSSSSSRKSAKQTFSQVFKDERTPSPFPARKSLRVDSDGFNRKRSSISVKRIICDDEMDLKSEKHMRGDNAVKLKSEKRLSHAVKEIKLTVPVVTDEKAAKNVSPTWGEKHPNPNPSAIKAFWSLDEKAWMVGWLRMFSNSLPGGDYIAYEQKLASLALKNLQMQKGWHKYFHPRHIKEEIWTDAFNHKTKSIDQKWGSRNRARLLQQDTRLKLLDGTTDNEQVRRVLVQTFTSEPSWQEEENEWLKKWLVEHPDWRLGCDGVKCFWDLVREAVFLVEEAKDDSLLAVFHPHHVHAEVIANQLNILYGQGEF